MFSYLHSKCSLSHLLNLNLALSVVFEKAKGGSFATDERKEGTVNTAPSGVDELIILCFRLASPFSFPFPTGTFQSEIAVASFHRE